MKLLWIILYLLCLHSISYSHKEDENFEQTQDAIKPIDTNLEEPDTINVSNDTKSSVSKSWWDYPLNWFSLIGDNDESNSDSTAPERVNGTIQETTNTEDSDGTESADNTTRRPAGLLSVQNLTEASDKSVTTVTCMLRTFTWANATENRVLLVDGKQFENHLRSFTSSQKSSSKSATVFTVPGSESKTQVQCTVVFIWAPWCRYSVVAAPTFNALARAFPQMHFLAIRVEDYWASKWSLHMFYIPKIKIYTNRKMYREFNGTDDDLYALIDFVQKTTGILPVHPVAVTAEDEAGPVPSILEPSTDVWLWVSTVAVLLSLITFVLRSTRGQRWKDRLVLLWQEHQHMP